MEGSLCPATSHTKEISQSDLLRALIEPFLQGKTPCGAID